MEGTEFMMYNSISSKIMAFAKIQVSDHTIDTDDLTEKLESGTGDAFDDLLEKIRLDCVEKFGDKIVSTHFQPLKILDYIKNRQRSFELNKLAMNLRGTQRRPVKIASLGNFDPLKDSPFKIGNVSRDLAGKNLDLLGCVKANDIKTMFDGTLVKITRTQRDHPQEGLKFCTCHYRE